MVVLAVLIGCRKVHLIVFNSASTARVSAFSRLISAWSRFICFLARSTAATNCFRNVASLAAFFLGISNVVVLIAMLSLYQAAQRIQGRT